MVSFKEKPSAWECFLIWFNITEDEAAKHPRLYKRRCVEVLDRIFSLSPRTYDRWSANKFAKMPEDRLKTLRVWLFARMIARAASLLDNESKLLIFEELKSSDFSQND